MISLGIGLFSQLPVQGQVAAPPYLLDVKSKQLKKLRGKVTDIWNDSKKSKEISQKSIDEMLTAYSEVEQKGSADDLPSAAYLVSNAYAVMGDRDTQMKYLDIVDSNYDKAAKQVKVLSRMDLGWNNYRGFGTPKNEDKALEYFIQCFEVDSIQGAYPMAMASLYGIGSAPVDFSLSAQLLLKSIHGLRWPLIYAINYYLDNVEKDPSVQQAWEDYLTGFELYTIYALPDEATPFIKKSVDAGFLPAYQLLGDIYLEKGDRETAISTVKPAIDAYYIPALHQKGWYIYSGTIGRLGQGKPIAEAYDLFLEAANAGYPPSQVTVAELCLVGSAGVVKIDNEMAFKQASAAHESGESLGADLAQRAQKAMTIPPPTIPMIMKPHPAHHWRELPRQARMQSIKRIITISPFIGGENHIIMLSLRL